MEKTCDHCGYQRTFCQCGRPRNTSGEVTKFQNYTDYTGAELDFGLTSPMRRSSKEQRAEKKYIEELNPTNKEKLYTYLQRTQKGMAAVRQKSHSYHLWETKKGIWPCHSTSRYCFICVKNQYLEFAELMAEKFLDLMDSLNPEIKGALRWSRTETEEEEDQYDLYFSKPLPKEIHPAILQREFETQHDSSPLDESEP